MSLLQDAYSFWTFLYFVPLLLIGSFFLMNLAIAIIKIKFTNIIMEVKKEPEQRPPDKTPVYLMYDHDFNVRTKTMAQERDSYFNNELD